MGSFVIVSDSSVSKTKTLKQIKNGWFEISGRVLNICATHRFTKEQRTVLCVLLSKLQWTETMSSCLGKELLILARRSVG